MHFVVLVRDRWEGHCVRFVEKRHLSTSLDDGREALILLDEGQYEASRPFAKTEASTSLAYAFNLNSAGCDLLRLLF